MGTAADSVDERHLRRGMTDTTTMFSENNMVMEGDCLSDSSFDAEADFETASSPAPPAIGDEIAAEQRANGALKGLTLTFRDPYLEADYQSARQRELHRSTLVFRITLLVLLVLWLVFNFVTLAVHRGLRTAQVRSDFLLSFLSTLPLAALIVCSFRHSFASRFEVLVGSASVTFIVLQNVIDYELVSCSTALETSNGCHTPEPAKPRYVTLPISVLRPAVQTAGAASRCLY